MRSDELERRLRVFEGANDLVVLPGIYMVARVDGRSFTKLTKERHDFERPFDARFRDHMLTTTEHLMTACGMAFTYAYTQSDEISLLFEQGDRTFGRKMRKLVSVLAGEASARFSLALGDVGVFDCRISQLPRERDVVDYFRWRQADCERNCLSAHAYWALRKNGSSEREATGRLEGASSSDKQDILHSLGINFNDLPAWQKRGIGARWVDVEVDATDPRTGEDVRAVRRRLVFDDELPLRDAYAAYVEGRIA